MKRVRWVGSSKKDYLKFPSEVQSQVGYDLFVVQCGDKTENTKPLHGFGGASVLEIVQNASDGTYRVVFTVKFEEAVYGPTLFQKEV